VVEGGVSPSDVLGQRNFKACLQVVGAKSLPAPSKLLQRIWLYRWRVQYKQSSVLVRQRKSYSIGRKSASPVYTACDQACPGTATAQNATLTKLRQTSQYASQDAMQAYCAKSSSMVTLKTKQRCQMLSGLYVESLTFTKSRETSQYAFHCSMYACVVSGLKFSCHGNLPDVGS